MDVCRISDKTTIDVDSGSLGSNECPSMTSSFSPADSPTPSTTPTTIYNHESLVSPGWSEGAYSAGTVEEPRTSPPLGSKSAQRMADITLGDPMPMHYGTMETHDKVPLLDLVPSYGDQMEQFWMAPDGPKGFDQNVALGYQDDAVPQYPPPPIVRGYHRTGQTACLPGSASNQCLSCPIFPHGDRLANSTSMSEVPAWLPLNDGIPPQTITPSQAFHEAPVTPPVSFAAFPDSASTIQTHTPTTPIPSTPYGTPAISTPIIRSSGGAVETYDDSWDLSSGIQEYLQRRPQRHLSRKMTKKQSTKQSFRLESLPSIIKQVQYRCKESGCKGRFKRQEHFKRHMKSHSKEKPHVCWVPGCNRGFSRSDNLNAHYTKTHSKRGGRNRYVATLDETNPDYDPDFRGQLTPDGRPIYGSKLYDPIPADPQDFDADSWDE
jgi:zinc finger protein BrlA